MKTPKQIDVQVLHETAKSSEHKEAYNVLDESKNYRIGVGARLPVPDHPSFFSITMHFLSRG